MRRALGFGLFVAVAVVTLAFLALPIVGIFVHTSPGKLLDQLSNPVVKDAFVVTAEDERARPGADPPLRHPDGLPARNPSLHRAFPCRHPGRVAARAAAGRGRNRPARSARPQRPARLQLERIRRLAPLHPDRGHDRSRLRRQPALHPAGDRLLRGDRSASDRSLAHARRRAGPRRSSGSCCRSPAAG